MNVFARFPGRRVPHGKRGEMPLAAVMLREGATATAEESYRWVSERATAR